MGACTHGGRTWHAILVEPVVQQLSSSASPHLFAQVRNLCWSCFAHVQIALWITSLTSSQQTCYMLTSSAACLLPPRSAGSVQVVADIATAIEGSAAKGVAHRDITPNNLGHIDERGLLYEFSAGKVSAEVTRPCLLASTYE